MIGLLGKKVGMTQVFDEEGSQRAVTVLEVGPCFVSDIKNEDKHGYSAVQLAYDPVKEKRVNRPHVGHLKKSGLPPLRILREVRTKDMEGLEVGASVHVDNFEVGDFVDVQGVTIGRGFQGVVKRHKFKGGEAAHGAKFGRESGSISQGSAFPSRIPKGRRMAGQMGNSTVTVQNLRVLKVDLENRLIAVKGAVPGVEGGYLMIQVALKRGKQRKWKVALSHAEENVKASQGKGKKESSKEASTEKPQKDASEGDKADSSTTKAATKDSPKASSTEVPKKAEDSQGSEKS